jgi:aryl-alcohol dehydrogenase-like predicted oxidoreductase
MTEFGRQTTLGRTGLQVGRLGISSSYGAPTAAIEEAFERGCNYFTWGSFLRGRSSQMGAAIRRIVQAGRRRELVLALVSYAHSGFLTEFFVKKALRSVGLEHADVLILGYYPRRPPRRVIEGALKLKKKNLVRFIGLTSHNRKLYRQLRKDGHYDVFHVRYNAVHRGAETETFPYLTGEQRPGAVSFTATSWQQLLKPNHMPSGQTPPTAADCYRFVLSHPSVDICMVGARSHQQMHENLAVLDSGPMPAEDLMRMRAIGDHIRRK